MPEEKCLKRRIAEKRFEWAVRALAQPAHLQLNLFPDFAHKTDELALEFDEWHRAFCESGASNSLQPEQARSINELDAQLSSMSGEHTQLWNDEALETRYEWSEARNLAAAVIDAMGWSKGPPPIDRGDKFVGGLGT